MDPSVWGSAAWDILYTVASHNDVESLEAIASLYARALPCEQCRTSFARILSELPVSSNDGADEDALLRWTHMVHSIVNQKLRRSEPPYEPLLYKYRVFQPYAHTELLMRLLLCMARVSKEEANFESAYAIAESIPDMRRIVLKNQLHNVDHMALDQLFRPLSPPFDPTNVCAQVSSMMLSPSIAPTPSSSPTPRLKTSMEVVEELVSRASAARKQHATASGDRISRRTKRLQHQTQLAIPSQHARRKHAFVLAQPHFLQ